jgi:PAS domain-containing protein
MLATSLMIDLGLQEDMPIVYVNHVFENATGYSAAEVLDMHKRTVNSMLELARRQHVLVLSLAHHNHAVQC